MYGYNHTENKEYTIHLKSTFTAMLEGGEVGVILFGEKVSERSNIFYGMVELARIIDIFKFQLPK